MAEIYWIKVLKNTEISLNFMGNRQEVKMQICIVIFYKKGPNVREVFHCVASSLKLKHTEKENRQREYGYPTVRMAEWSKALRSGRSLHL